MKPNLFTNTFQNRVVTKALFGLAMALATLLPLVATGSGQPARSDAGTEAELPRAWDGRALRPLALSAVEQRFADRFPGRIARLTDGERIVVLRSVAQPTRMLHPAADCYRALGWRISGEGLHAFDRHDGIEGVQRCFIATRHGQTLRVCEYIVDGHGAVYSDTSAWYWDALLGRSHAGWLAVTVAEPWRGSST